MTRTKPTSGSRTAIKALAIASLAALGLTACDNGGGNGDAGAGNGEETYSFTLATGALEGTPHSAVEQAYLDAVEESSDGRIEFDRTSFEALCDMAEVVECLRDGRADIGTSVPDYTPNMLPFLTTVGIPFLNTDIQATTAALYDTHTDYEPAVDLLEQNNLHYISTWPVGGMLIGSQSPVENLEDVDGLRARATGPITQLSLESAGASVNAVTAAETYESLQRGVIDSVAASLDFAVQYQVTEQLPYWVDPGLGQYAAYGMWWSQSSYESLPDDLQGVVDEVTEEFNYGETIEAFNGAMSDICEGMLESQDVEEFTQWDESATDEWRAEVGDDAEELWLETVTDYGVEGAEEYLDEYRAAYDSHENPDNPNDMSLSCVDEWQEQSN